MYSEYSYVKSTYLRQVISIETTGAEYVLVKPLDLDQRLMKPVFAPGTVGRVDPPPPSLPLLNSSQRHKRHRQKKH